jgi:hypothetical protein
MSISSEQWDNNPDAALNRRAFLKRASVCAALGTGIVSAAAINRSGYMKVIHEGNRENMRLEKARSAVVALPAGYMPIATLDTEIHAAIKANDTEALRNLLTEARKNSVYLHLRSNHQYAYSQAQCAHIYGALGNATNERLCYAEAVSFNEKSDASHPEVEQWKQRNDELLAEEVERFSKGEYKIDLSENIQFRASEEY